MNIAPLGRARIIESRAAEALSTELAFQRKGGQRQPGWAPNPVV